MPVISIDLNELSAVSPGITNLKTASIDFSPYRAYATDDDKKVTRAIRKVKTANGIAAPFFPPTPTGNAYEVQERGFRGARHGFVLVPDVAGPIPYTDLVWVDKDTLDPEAPLSPAWLAALEQVQDDLDDKLDKTGLDAAAKALVADPTSETAAAVNAKISATQRALTDGAVTYNGDGTVATSVAAGITTTYTYNSDGTLHTEARDGKTTTYAYTAGVLTGWSVA